MDFIEKLKLTFPVTGMMIIRESTQEETPDSSGRRLLSFVGIIAAPADFGLKGEHQYVIVANNDGSLQFTIMNSEGRDVSAVSVGESFAGLLSKPIWQV